MFRRWTQLENEAMDYPDGSRHDLSRDRAGGTRHLPLREATAQEDRRKYQIGLRDHRLNPQFKNPDLIYPGDKVTIPNIDDIKAIEAEAIRLTNAQRSRYGLPALKSNWELSRVARYKSADMRDNRYFSHTSPVYGGPFQMISAFGIWYSAAGENIAAGRSCLGGGPGLMNSPGHRANILSNNYTQIGIGLATDSTGTNYWTQMFIRQ